MDNYNFVQLSNNNYTLTKALYKKAFGLNYSVSSIKKKYDTSMFGNKNIGYFATDTNNKPAAYYGVFPMVMEFDSQDIPVAQSGDTMTAPEHQKKGLFVKLAKKTYQLAEEKGIQLVFGFPNENSFPGFQKKLDWQFFGSMYKFTINNDVLPISELCSKFNILNTIYDKYCNIRLAKFSIKLSEENIESFNKTKNQGYIKKDINFFRYKLNRPGIHLIRINNFSLLIKPRTHLMVGDVGFFEKERLVDFIRTLDKISQLLGCGKTIISVSKNHWLYGYLIPEIEPKESLPIGYFPINQTISLEDISFTQADYDTF